MIEYKDRVLDAVARNIPIKAIDKPMELEKKDWQSLRGLDGDKFERALIIDPINDEHDEPKTSIWFAEVPVHELLQVDANARARYTMNPKKKRLVTWLALPTGSIMITIAILLFSLGADTSALLPALVFGTLGGWPFGLIAAWIIVKKKLKIVALWTFNRIYIDNGSKYQLEPITPSGLINDYFAQSEANRDKVIVIRGDYMKRVVKQLAARRLYRSRNSKADKIMFASLMVIALGLFALIFLVQAMTNNGTT